MTTTSPQPQPQGDIFANINRRHQHGDNLPAFEGTIQHPVTKAEHAMALWAREFVDKKTGEVKTYFRGRTALVGRNLDVEAQLAALVAAGKPADETLPELAQDTSNLNLEPGEVLLFPNGFREQLLAEHAARLVAEGKDPEKEKPKNPPHYWGRWNANPREPLVSNSVWLSKSRVRRNYGELVLSGFTQYPQPSRNHADQQHPASSIFDLERQGVLSRGMPDKGKRKTDAAGDR